MKRLPVSCVFALAAMLAATSGAASFPQKDGAKKSAAAAAPADVVAAAVNGERIMLSELLGRLDELGVAPQKREAVAENVLNGLVDNALIIQFLAAQRIPFDSKKVEAEIAEMRADYEKQGQKLGEALAQMGLTEPKLRAAAIAEAQWQNYLAKSVTDKQLADYFAKHRESFDGTEVRASHILVEVSETANEGTRAAAKAKAESIRKELNKGGEFAAAAKKHSDCPSKEQAGDVGWFIRSGKMVEPFAKAAFAQKPGEVGPVVETEFGYHVIVVTGRKPGTRTKLNDPELRKDLLEACGDQVKDEIVAKQRKVAKIEIAPGSTPAAPAAVKTATQPGKTKK